jgi:Tol biopolymer transport system component
LGAKTVTYLEGNGFNVQLGGNADRLDYETSIIFARSDYLVTAYSIAALLDLPQSTVVESPPSSDQVDIEVVLGLDYQLPGLIGEPAGKIVFTCQIFKDRKRNQICLMNADGSEQRRLTQADEADHLYPSVAPDGQSVVFSSNLSGEYEIYELDLSGALERLTSKGECYAPEISQDGERIVFAHTGTTHPGVWIMNRDGTHPHPVTDHESWGAWDPVWSPNGDEILFASDQLGAVELFRIRPDGSERIQVTRAYDIFGDERRIRGRNAWSPDGTMIASYIGQHWDWDLFMVDQNGGNLQLLTSGGDSLAPSFSPDSRWITYTSYEHNPDVSWACEIYIMLVDGSERRRLTDNGYCDWQPRWGP